MTTEQPPATVRRAAPGDDVPAPGAPAPRDAADATEATEATAEAAIPPQAEPAETEKPQTKIKDSPGTTEHAQSASDGGEVSPTDRWAKFVSTDEPPPTRSGRGCLVAVGRVLRHEWTLAAIICVAAAVVMTWPTMRYPLHTIPQDIWDPTLSSYLMAWNGHILLTDPARLFDTNAFFPEQWTLAFSDPMLGYAPLSIIGEGPVAAVLRFNIIFVLAHALAAFGAYALVRQLGGGKTGAAVAAAAYAYAPWLLSQSGHLHILSNGGVPLAIAMLARGHGFSFRHGYRPDRRHAGWAAAGWLTAAWQLSNGFGVGLVFAYVLLLIVVGSAIGWFIRRTWFWGVRRPFGRKLFITDLFGGAVFAATGGLLAIPFYEVIQANPHARRTLAEIAFYSPPFRGLLTAPPESKIWGESHAPLREALQWAPEGTLLPGFVLIGLAAAGLIFSVWSLRVRLMLAAGVAITAVLAMGTEFEDGKYTYIPLFEHVPGWDGIRTPGRLILWTTLLLAILAAGTVSAFVERVGEITAERIPPWPHPFLRLATFIPLVLVLAEGLNTTPHPIVPTQPAAMRSVEGPMLVLPSAQLTDMNVMLWSTTKFQDLVNGGSGFTPTKLDEVRKVTAAFPDQASVDYLRQLGVRNVVVMRDWVVGTPMQTTIDLPVDSLGIQREDVGNTVVYRL